MAATEDGQAAAATLAPKESLEPESKLAAAAATAAAEDAVVVEDDEGDDELPPEARPAFERNELPASGAKFREDAVHVYGLDFLRSEHMNEIFSQFEHKFIEWINDSSANIVFRSKDSAFKALEALSYPKARDKPWRRTPDILVNEDYPPIFLQLRLAATTDVKRGRRAVPKLTESDLNARAAGRGRAGRAGVGRLGSTYRDGMTTELLEQAGLLGKRPAAPPPTGEELSKRQRRTERFGAVEPAPGAAEGRGAAVAAASKLGAEPPKLDEEEVARRKKRANRFGEGADAGATTAAADSAATPGPEAAAAA